MKAQNLKALILAGIVAGSFLQPMSYEAFASTISNNTVQMSLQDSLNEYVNIPDSNLRKVLNEKYLHQSADAPITRLQLRRLKGTLYLGASNISDLTGLENCLGVTGLYLGYNSITDITPLKGLKNLKTLNLVNQKIQGEDVVTTSNDVEVKNKIKDMSGKNIAPVRSKEYSYHAPTNVIKFNNINGTGEKAYKFNSKVTFGNRNLTTYFSGEVSHKVIK